MYKNPSKNKMKSAFKSQYVNNRGRTVSVISIPVKAGVKDYARAAAMNHANEHREDKEVYLGEPGTLGVSPYQPNGVFLGEPGTLSGNSIPNSNPKKPFDQTFLGQLLGAGANLAGQAVNAKVTGGKSITKDNAVSILSGLGQDYVKECVRKYKSGESMTEFERKVAMAEIELEKQGKGLVARSIGEWIIDHAAVLGAGIVGIVLIITLSKRR